MILSKDPVLFEAYSKLCERFSELYEVSKKISYTDFPVSLTKEEIRLLWLSLAASKARLVAFDPAKGLNQ